MPAFHRTTAPAYAFPQRRSWSSQQRFNILDFTPSERSFGIKVCRVELGYLVSLMTSCKACTQNIIWCLGEVTFICHWYAHMHKRFITGPHTAVRSPKDFDESRGSKAAKPSLQFYISLNIITAHYTRAVTLGWRYAGWFDIFTEFQFQDRMAIYNARVDIILVISLEILFSSLLFYYKKS